MPYKELKPCPFCGGKSVFNEDKFKHGTVYSVYCEDCGAEIADFNKEKAIETWNRRTE